MIRRAPRRWMSLVMGIAIALSSVSLAPHTAPAQETSNAELGLPRDPDRTVECDVLIIGGGLAGTATAYESLKAGRTVCLTEMTDWVGGQISSQGTTALDESRRQRQLLFYAAGYLKLRDRVAQRYGEQNPGRCWVSASCFMPEDAHDILFGMLTEAAREGRGELKWFPSTVPKAIATSPDGRQITRVIGLRHHPAPGAPPLNTEPLSQTIEDAYRYEDSDRFQKTILEFVPRAQHTDGPADWYVVEATETGEVIALADVPYRLGLDPQSALNPSSPVRTADPYCTQGFTYTFAMEKTRRPSGEEIPEFYWIYQPYFSYERARDGFRPLDYYDFVFTYRRLLSTGPRRTETIAGVPRPRPGDISMQNWTWGNDYRPGTAVDNLIYTHEQLVAEGQLEPGGWLGGLRTETLRRGEENALAYYYWLAFGSTDSQLDDAVKEPFPNSRLLTGFNAPMGTAHGLSKHPYMREGRRIIGRPSFGYDEGFAINEIDFTWVDFNDPFYRDNLTPEMYRALWQELAGINAVDAIMNRLEPSEIDRRTRSRIYPDSVGIAQYAIDFHPCMAEAPPEAPGNIERPGVRQAHGPAYPAQIPLRAMIPQRIDNLLVASKSIAASTIAAAAYRVHSFEWSVGAAAGITIDFALRNGVMPYELVDNLPSQEPQLEALRREIEQKGNPTKFPDTSIFNENWDDWRPW